MTKVCHRCNHPDNDAVNFCQDCGYPLEPLLDRQEMSGLQAPDVALPDAQQGCKRMTGIIVITALAFIIITAVLIAMQGPGHLTVLPVMTTAATPQPATAALLSTPTAALPTATTLPMTITTAGTAGAGSPVTSPAPAKVLFCPSDQRACGANCMDTLTDQKNCGTCGVSCGAGQICQYGQCTKKCPVGEVTCSGGCSNLSYDAQNCGACGNSCPFGLACNRSVCSPPLVTTIPTYAG